MQRTGWFEVWQNLRTGEATVTIRGHWAYQRRAHWQAVQAYRTEEAAMSRKQRLEAEWEIWEEPGI